MNLHDTVKQAWGKLWKKNQWDIDEYGWIEYEKGMSCAPEMNYETCQKNSKVLVRPLSLVGLEENNGWILLEDESNSPKNQTECWFMVRDKIYKGSFEKHFFTGRHEGIEKDNDNSSFGSFNINSVKCYYPIITPEKPIFTSL